VSAPGQCRVGFTGPLIQYGQGRHAKLCIQEARKQCYANFVNVKKRKVMLEELEEAEPADREAKSAEATKKQKFVQEAEQIRDAGRRVVEERQAELQRQQEEAECVEKSAQEELEPPPLGVYLSPPSSMFIICVHAFTGEHDTIVRLKYPLAKYLHLTTTDALHMFMSNTFGPVVKDSIVLSLYPKKAPHKPPKYVTAAVPFACSSCATQRPGKMTTICRWRVWQAAWGSFCTWTWHQWHWW
jgi:DnaJ family protein C protein 17